jgi:hypothetical protein
MAEPRVLIMPPYQPVPEASSVSALMTWAYEGWRSSRRGGCTLMMGSLGPLTGAGMSLLDDLLTESPPPLVWGKLIVVAIVLVVLLVCCCCEC